MGKIRTRVLGYEDIEAEQKKKQKERSQEKKASKSVESQDEKQPETKPEPKKMKKKSHGGPKRRVGHGRKYNESMQKVDKKKVYSSQEAIASLKAAAFAKFDESFELHLNLDKKGIKGEVELPFSTGKTTRVRIVDDALLDELENGVIEFDVLISHPSYMPKLAKYAKTLGPKGLMPNPKTGTISPKPEEVAKKFEKGTMRWKAEPKFPLLHQMIGKVSMKDEELRENIIVFMKSVGKSNIEAAFLTTSMGPSVKLDLSEIE